LLAVNLALPNVAHLAVFYIQAVWGDCAECAGRLCLLQSKSFARVAVVSSIIGYVNVTAGGNVQTNTAHFQQR